VGEGSKLYDRTKTGQFGVGFNAVYHLTDVPSFITRGPEIPSGGMFCVFDPHCWHVPIATTDSPGMKMKLCKFKSKYEDIYDRYLQDILPAETGTWFRFPLRTNDPECNSKISTNRIMKKDMIQGSFHLHYGDFHVVMIWHTYRIKLHNLPECMKYLSFSIWAKTKDCFSFVLSF
jgi:sacsin